MKMKQKPSKCGESWRIKSGYMPIGCIWGWINHGSALHYWEWRPRARKYVKDFVDAWRIKYWEGSNHQTLGTFAQPIAAKWIHQLGLYWSSQSSESGLSPHLGYGEQLTRWWMAKSCQNCKIESIQSFMNKRNLRKADFVGFCVIMHHTIHHIDLQPGVWPERYTNFCLHTTRTNWMAFLRERIRQLLVE